ncbi:hypothetical protein DH2020_033524 [Rehmannia glutinosa]|uniref:ABC transporter domain-containing protein n=1 Tax=Rehmannia glutinosa TaxID=99300 RepID=A0ABR0VF75_REHGL
MVDVEAQNQEDIDGEITPAAAIFKKANLPVTLKFEDVVYKIKTEQGRGSLKPHKKSQEKLILKGISGTVLPGEMLAMLGPSGSGKTTLLTALGGRLGGGHLSGTITYNTKPFSNAMKRNTGFVTQDDILYPHLTVTETLVYTALLRLPRNLTRDEKTRHAEAVINQLGLSRCKNSIIAASGLDSDDGSKIVSALWELANGGRTIVMTIHQPSSRLFYMFHKVLLLSEGNPLYYGKGSSALQFFESVGFAPSVAMNPADFLLDLANGVATADSHEDQAAIKQALVSAYKAHLSESVKSELANDNELQVSTDDKRLKRWSNTWWDQFSVLFRRGIKERKHESFSTLKIAQVLVVAILSGLLWWGFSSFALDFGASTLSSKPSSLSPRTNDARQRTIFGHVPSLLLLHGTNSRRPPNGISPPHNFLHHSLLDGGLKPTPGSFFAGLFVLLYSVLCSQGLGLAIGAAVMDQKSATVLGSTYPCDSDKACLVEDFPSVKPVGLEGHAVSVIVLGIMIVGYRLIAYLALMRIGVTRK